MDEEIICLVKVHTAQTRSIHITEYVSLHPCIIRNYVFHITGFDIRVEIHKLQSSFFTWANDWELIFDPFLIFPWIKWLNYNVDIYEYTCFFLLEMITLNQNHRIIVVAHNYTCYLAFLHVNANVDVCSYCGSRDATEHKRTKPTAFVPSYIQIFWRTKCSNSWKRSNTLAIIVAFN